MLVIWHRKHTTPNYNGPCIWCTRSHVNCQYTVSFASKSSFLKHFKQMPEQLCLERRMWYPLLYLQEKLFSVLLMLSRSKYGVASTRVQNNNEPVTEAMGRPPIYFHVMGRPHIYFHGMGRPSIYFQIMGRPPIYFHLLEGHPFTSMWWAGHPFTSMWWGGPFTSMWREGLPFTSMWWVGHPFTSMWWGGHSLPYEGRASHLLQYDGRASHLLPCDGRASYLLQCEWWKTNSLRKAQTYACVFIALQVHSDLKENTKLTLT